MALSFSILPLFSTRLCHGCDSGSYLRAPINWGSLDASISYYCDSMRASFLSADVASACFTIFLVLCAGGILLHPQIMPSYRYLRFFEQRFTGTLHETPWSRWFPSRKVCPPSYHTDVHLRATLAAEKFRERRASGRRESVIRGQKARSRWDSLYWGEIRRRLSHARPAARHSGGVPEGFWPGWR